MYTVKWTKAPWRKRLAAMLALAVLLTVLTVVPGEALAAGTGVWEAVGSAEFSAGEAEITSLAMDNGTVYVAYKDNVYGGKATVMKYAYGSGSDWETVGSEGFSAGGIVDISLAVYNGTPYVAYVDGGNGNRATVMKYTGTGWETVGPAGFSSTVYQDHISLVMDNGTPYVAYADAENFERATVMRYTGTSWEMVGSAISPVRAEDISLAVYNGTPYVAYIDVGDMFSATVKKYTGTSWETVGSAGFSDEYRHNTSLVIDDGTPYVSFGLGSCYVMEYTGGGDSGWEDVGSSISVGESADTSFAVDDGTPYLAFWDPANGDKATVVKYTGTSWEPVGSAGFSADTARFVSLVMSHGVPYVAYQDGGNYNRLTVMRFNGPVTDVKLDNYSVQENKPAGTVVGNLSVQDINIYEEHTYSLVPGEGSEDNVSFTIDGDTLKTTETFVYDSKDTYRIRISATDSVGSSHEERFTIKVLKSEPYDKEEAKARAQAEVQAGATGSSMVVNMGSVPRGAVGDPYRYAPTVSNGAAPYSWTAAGLPAGLGIDSTTGAISGTPTAAGTGAVSATVTDSLGAALTIHFDIVIDSAGIAIENQSLPGGKLGETYTCALIASGGDGGYTWHATGLPGGLTLNAGTGEITDRPLVSGTFPVEVSVYDGEGRYDTESYQLTVAPQTETGRYEIEPEPDAGYTAGSTQEGVTTLTIHDEVSGFLYFSVSVQPNVIHEGEEMVIFVHMRGGVQIGFSFVKGDFDAIANAGAGFNVQPGDVIKVYIVDALSNDPGVNPVLLQ